MARQSKVEHVSGIALNCVLVAVCLGTLVKGGDHLWAPPWRGVFEPADGVVCDRQRAFCADEQGISLPLTTRYLGRSASTALQAASAGRNATGWRIFTLSNGMVCDSAARQCYLDDTRKAVSSVMTENLYSRKGGHTGE